MSDLLQVRKASSFPILFEILTSSWSMLIRWYLRQISELFQSLQSQGRFVLVFKKLWPIYINIKILIHIKALSSPWLRPVWDMESLWRPSAVFTSSLIWGCWFWSHQGWRGTGSGVKSAFGMQVPDWHKCSLMLGCLAWQIQVGLLWSSSGLWLKALDSSVPLAGLNSSGRHLLRSRFPFKYSLPEYKLL